MEYAEKLLDAALEESEGLTYKIGEIKVTGSSADVSAALGEKEFVISLTQLEGGGYTGEVPKELTEYLESLKEDPDEPDKPEPKEDPKPANDPKPKHEHKYTSKVTKEATCTKEGVKTYTCSCGDSYTKPIKAKGHSYKDTVVAPTKTAKGYTLHTCTVCGYEYKDKFTDPIAEDPKPPEDPKPVHTHEWEEVYETVHHKDLIHDAWDEEIKESFDICKLCGKKFTSKSRECDDHISFEHDGDATYTTVVEVIDIIHHDAEYKEWDEQVLTGYKCKTCGETKGVGGNAVILPEDKKKKYK